MKHLYNPAHVDEIKLRLTALTPGSQRLWGTMVPAQALAHCSGGLEMAVGDQVPPRLLLGRLIGRMIKGLVLGNDAPMRRNSPTVKALQVRDERDLDRERERLCDLIDRFTTAGPAGCTMHPHSFFGRLTPNEWAVLMYKHLDHHLRQFGA